MANYQLVDADQLDADLASVADSIRRKGGTSDQLAFPDEFKSAVEAISTGVTVQRKSGSFTTGASGAASVDCGFQPDLVVIGKNSTPAGTTTSVGFPFSEVNLNSIANQLIGPSTSYVFSDTVCSRTSNGFSVQMTKIATDFSQSADSGRTLQYTAVKYS